MKSCGAGGLARAVNGKTQTSCKLRPTLQLDSPELAPTRNWKKSAVRRCPRSMSPSWTLSLGKFPRCFPIPAVLTSSTK